MKKRSKAYKTIGEVAEILELESTGKKKNTHTIRFWESEFKQIKPIIINKRRHYDNKNIDLLKKIKFLLKNRGMTISGARKQLNEDFFDVDADENKTINAIDLKYKLNKINKLVKDLKNSNGKKNTR
ncbi:MAG: MerR family transcriptional regulator [Pseudomonadota bacterium]|nr:MerR family transcriptional regulator [Pseudomonadota bacterium]